jgi:hypothetical protein
MKLSAEEREAISLNKEYLMHKKYAERAGVPKLESDYYNKMAASTASKINWKLLKPHKKIVEEESYEEEFGLKESRNRYHK